MVRPKLTILTDPVPHGRYFVPEVTKSLARAVRDRVKPHPSNYNRSKYRGHPGVTRSLIEGLTRIGASFNYNPKSPKEFADVVLVLSGVETVRQMIAFKRKGLIKTLYAGPNIDTFSSPKSILASQEVDWVITPCDWVIDLYEEDCPPLKGRCFAWPAGVRTEYWKPDPTIKRKQILIFEKQNTGSVGPVQPYATYLEKQGYEVSIIKYGCFTHPQYLKELQQSILMIGFVATESQGIAWAEAWSTDVPTLIWKNTSHVYCGRIYRCSTAPYLCAKNGLFFDGFEDFKLKLDYWASHHKTFLPRTWILENMSDEVCASALYKQLCGGRSLLASVLVR